MADFTVPMGDPHNDQMAARAHHDLKTRLLEPARAMRAGAAKDGHQDEAAMTALVAATLIRHGWDTSTLASLLAAAVIQLTRPAPTPDTGSET